MFSFFSTTCLLCYAKQTVVKAFAPALMCWAGSSAPTVLLEGSFLVCSLCLQILPSEVQQGPEAP